mgnify:CR=1 FL=1
MFTTNSLEVLRRLCSDPCLCEHEAAVGVCLVDAPEEEPEAEPTLPRSPVDIGALMERLLAGMPLPDGDDGVEGVL